MPPLPPADAAERSKSSIREKGGGCGRQFSQIHQIAYRAVVNQGLCLYAKGLSGERSMDLTDTLESQNSSSSYCTCNLGPWLIAVKCGYRKTIQYRHRISGARRLFLLCTDCTDHILQARYRIAVLAYRHSWIMQKVPDYIQYRLLPLRALRRLRAGSGVLLPSI